MALKVFEQWIDSWRGNQSYWYESTPVYSLVAFDDLEGFDYYLRSTLEGSICTVELVRRAFEDEEIPLNVQSHSCYIAANGAHESTGFWGEAIACEWLASQGIEWGCENERLQYYYGR